MIREYVGYIDLDERSLSGSIPEIMAYITERFNLAQTSYPNHTNFNAEFYSNYDNVEWSIYANRLETPEELALKIAQEKKREQASIRAKEAYAKRKKTIAAKNEAADKAEYERLKAKFSK